MCKGSLSPFLVISKLTEGDKKWDQALSTVEEMMSA